MLRRKALDLFDCWKARKTHQALLVTGARQVGKTYLIREFAKANYRHVAEINMLENNAARKALREARDSQDLFTRLSVYADVPLVPKETVIFLDEIQEFPEIITAIKFLVSNTEFDYILSGSLLGVELRNIRSVPVGFMTTVKMYPLDFEEFCWANGIPESALSTMSTCFKERKPLEGYLHERLSALFHEYLVCGGMPDAVQAFLDTRDLQRVRLVQTGIADLYRMDISKYAPSERARTIKRIYDLIPSELSQQNKRFKLGSIEGTSRITRYENDFLWLVDALVAIAVYNVEEPRYPLMLSMAANLFKLFCSDTGLLTCQCGMDVVRDLYADRADINYGALYENVVAQELTAHGLTPYYFKNKKLGEMDFVVEWPRGYILPIEVKSGKNYKRHNALSNVLKVPNYGINQALVLYEGNLEVEGSVTYCPVYMVGCLGVD